MKSKFSPIMAIFLIVLLCVGTLFSGISTAQYSNPINESADQWRTHGGYPGGTNYNPGSADLKNSNNIEINWKRDLAESEDTSGLLPVTDGETIFAPAKSSVLALDQSTGKTIWSFNPSSDSNFETSPAVGQENVFAVSLNGGGIFSSPQATLFALDSNSGDVNWKAMYPPDTWYWGPTVAGDLVYVTHGSTVVAFNKQNGEKRWEHQLENRIWARPVVSDGNLIVGTVSGEVISIDSGSGVGVWKTETSEGEIRDIAATEQGIVISDTNSLVHIDSGSGIIDWSTEAGTDGSGFNSLAITENMIYASTLGSTQELVGVSRSNGSVVWKRSDVGHVPDPAWTSQIAVGKNSVYFGNQNNEIYSLNRYSGEIRWKRLNSGTTMGPIITSKGLFVGSKSGSLTKMSEADNMDNDRSDTNGADSTSPSTSESDDSSLAQQEEMSRDASSSQRDSTSILDSITTYYAFLTLITVTGISIGGAAWYYWIRDRN